MVITGLTRNQLYLIGTVGSNPTFSAIFVVNVWGLSSAGRALASHARGRWFESSSSHHTESIRIWFSLETDSDFYLIQAYLYSQKKASTPVAFS